MLEMMAVSLALTLLLELSAALLWGLRGRREMAVAALVNLLTNPVVVLLHYTGVTLLDWPQAPVTAALEASAVVVEWRCYRACSEQLKKPLLFAILANALSYGAGVLLNFL